MQLVTQIEFSESGLTMRMFIIMEYSIYRQQFVKQICQD